LTQCQGPPLNNATDPACRAYASPPGAHRLPPLPTLSTDDGMLSSGDAKIYPRRRIELVSFDQAQSTVADLSGEYRNLVNLFRFHLGLGWISRRLGPLAALF